MIPVVLNRGKGRSARAMLGGTDGKAYQLIVTAHFNDTAWPDCLLVVYRYTLAA
jgi:hypothetical protein